MSIASISPVSPNFTSLMQPSATASSAQAGAFQQALTSTANAPQPASQTAAAQPGTPSTAKAHHGHHHHGGGQSGSSASQASTLISTLSGMTGSSVDISA